MDATDQATAAAAEDPEEYALRSGLASLSRAYLWLKSSLVDRDVEARLAIVALVARQHLFLLGPPGTAKSLLSRRVGQLLGEAPYFELLLTRFTDPSEVFGPVSVQKLVKEDVYERKVAGYLPEAEVAFLDEIWKASSAILNSLLTIVNERIYHNGGKVLGVPLNTLFAASNELPQDDSLAALYDRFLLRREVRSVSDPTVLLDLPDPGPPPVLRNLDAVQAACRRVEIGQDIRESMKKIRDALEQGDITVGDRRFQQSASLVRASALVGGRADAEPDDLHVLANAWWNTPDQYGEVARAVQAEVARTSSSRAQPQRTQAANNPASSNTGGVPAGGSAPWAQVLSAVRNRSVEQIARDQAIHRLIHDCIVSPEAQTQTYAQAARELCQVKQAVVNMGMWRGPNW